VTWSIIAKDAGGAVASQALTNPLYGQRGLALLRLGVPAAEVVRLLIAADTGHPHRQVHVMDGSGAFAAHTGAECVDWCGHLIRDMFSVAGNMLAGPQVIAETARAYEADAALPFPRRLIAAMKAGEDAGGDKRGKQSAALLIYSTEDYSDLDLRVDDHPEPLEELARLEKVSRERWVHFRKFLPKRGDPVGETDRDVINAGIDKALASKS
jgi:uncharacterized Ntn-hydrolase superfamily protein